MPSRQIVNVDGIARLPGCSHAVVSRPWVHVSGTCGTVDETFDFVPGDTGEQTSRALSNIERILSACGATLEDVVRLDIHLVDMEDFAAFNAAYTAIFGEDSPPTRTTVSTPKLGPRNARVEINCVAYLVE